MNHNLTSRNNHSAYSLLQTNTLTLIFNVSCKCKSATLCSKIMMLCTRGSEELLLRELSKC